MSRTEQYLLDQRCFLSSIATLHCTTIYCTVKQVSSTKWRGEDDVTPSALGHYTCISFPVDGPPALEALLYTSESVVPTSCAQRTSSST
jgi:hypothetical protein